MYSHVPSGGPLEYAHISENFTTRTSVTCNKNVMVDFHLRLYLRMRNVNFMNDCP